MSVCLCVSAYMSRVSMSWDKEGPGQSLVQAGRIGGMGRLCVPLFCLGSHRPAFQLQPRTTPTPVVQALPSTVSPVKCPSPQPAQGGGVSYCPHTPPPNHGSTPPCSLGSLDTGAGEGWWGEALKAGDCLGELGDRAPIVPAPEPPQWSSLTQRGFDNGPDISMQNQPLSPLTVPQPRGGSWGAAGSGRQGGAQLRLRRH